MKRIFYFLPLLWLACAGNPQDEETNSRPIVLEVPQNAPQGSLTIDKIVPLETNDESVFGQFYKMDIQEGDIYILDRIFTRNLYHFDKTGKFVNKLLTGKGPGEIIHTYSMYLDKSTNEVYVYDAGNDRMSVLDKSLNSVRTIPVNSHVPFHHFSRLRGNQWLVQANYKSSSSADSSAQYVVLDNDFQEIQQSCLPLSSTLEIVSMLSPISVNAGGHVLFSGVYDNNLYTISDMDELVVKYRVDFGSYNLTENDLDTDDHTTITKLWQEGKRKTYLDHVQETDKFVGFTYWFVDKMEFCVFSKSGGSLVVCSEFAGSEDFIMGTLMELTDQYIILAADPADVMDYINISQRQENRFSDLVINESDNPVLVYYRLEDVL